MGRLPDGMFKRDFCVHVYLSYLFMEIMFAGTERDSAYMERMFAGTFFAQPGSRQKQDNFYHVNTPSRFAILYCPR